MVFIAQYVIDGQTKFSSWMICLQDLVIVKVSSAQPGVKLLYNHLTSSSEEAHWQLKEHLQHLDMIHVPPCGNKIHLSL